MKERIFFPIFPTWSAADNHDRRFFGVGACDRIQDIESAHAVRDATKTDAVNPEKSISGKPRGRLVRHRNVLDLRFLQPRKCRQREIAWNAEAVANTPPIEVFEQKLA